MNELSGIDICLASRYNEKLGPEKYKKYLNAQIESIADQIAPQDHIYIADDGNGAYINEAMRLFFSGKSNYTVITDEIGGARQNFQRALETSLSDNARRIIVLADQDDIWREGV